MGAIVIGARLLISAVSASLLTACATLPSYREDAVSTADVILNIRCELRDAVWEKPSNAWAQTWIAGLSFGLDVTHVGGLDVDTSWIFPLSRGAGFTVGPIAGFSGQATRKQGISFNERLDFLKNDEKLRCAAQEPDRYARLGGEIGIADLLERVTRSVEKANIQPKELSYNLDFVIKKNAGITPRFSLVPIGTEKDLTALAKWAGSYSDTQSLKIVLTPRPAQDAKGPDCDHELVSGKCPIPVYQVEPKIKPKAKARVLGRRSVDGGPASSPRDTSRGLSPRDDERLERAQTRNLLDRIEGELRQRGIGE